MRRSSRIQAKQLAHEAEAKNPEEADDGDEEEEQEQDTQKKNKNRNKAKAKGRGTPKKKATVASSPKRKGKTKAAAATTRGRKRKAAAEEEEGEGDGGGGEEHDTNGKEAGAAQDGGADADERRGPRRSKRLRGSVAKDGALPDAEEKMDLEDEDEEGEEEEEEEEVDGDGEFDVEGGEQQLSWRQQRRRERLAQRQQRYNGRGRGRGRGRGLVRSNSYSANDLLNASYRDLFGLGAAPGPSFARRGLMPPPRAPAATASSSSATDNSGDRWVLLRHHHWLLRNVPEDGRLMNLMNYPSMVGMNVPLEALEDIADEADEPQINLYTDEEGKLPLYFDPPADGSSCFDELPVETLMHIFSFFNAATMAQGMSVCKSWKELLSDNYFWKKQLLLVEPLVLKPVGHHSWNQFTGYAVRFIKDEPVLGRLNPLQDIDTLRPQNYNYSQPSAPQDWEFEEVWDVNPVTSRSEYVLSRNVKYIDKKFGLGLIVLAGGWGNYQYYGGDPWWLEHYAIGSRREEDLLRPDGKYKTLCNPKLWRWRLLHSDGKDEVTGVLLVNIGYLERLVDEGTWESEISKIDLEFLYLALQETFTQFDYRLYEQQTIPNWLQSHKKAERERRIAARKLLRESLDKGKDKVDAMQTEEPPASLEVDAESQASQQEGTTAVEDKPFRFTKPDGIVSKLYSYQLESLTWMTEIEDRVSRGMYWEIIRYLTFPDNVGTDILINPDGFALARYHQLDKYQHFLRVYTRGGILAEEMGLGKTLIVLSLITLQRQNIDKIFARDETLNPIDPVPVAEFVAILSHAHYDPKDHIRTKATIVLCPSHLAQQWASEVVKHTKPALKVLVITTIVQHRAITYQDIIDADVVIVSFSFLINKNYENVRGAKLNGISPDSPKLAKMRSPLLTQFRWLRMILDEAHELQSGRSYKGKTGTDELNLFQATFRWYVTGSPFPNGRHSLVNALTLLRTKVKKPVDPNHKGPKTDEEKNQEESFNINTIWGYNTNPWSPNLEKEFMKNLYCRHTKQSVSNEYTLPGVTNQVVLLRQTIIERTLYEVAKIENRDDEMRQICCHPQLTATYHRMGFRDSNLWSIFADTIETKKSQITSTKKSLENLKKSLESHMQHFKDLKRDWKRQRAWLPNWKPSKGEQERKLGLKNTIRKEKKELSSLEASLKMYTESLAYLEEVDSQYQIVKQSKKKAKGKPHKSLIDEEDNKEGIAILEAAVKELPSASYNLPDSVSEDMVAVHGSKMSHLLVFVQQLCEENEDARIIIFSQWTRLLILIGNLLEEHDVRTIFCRGNVFQRNKAISAFQKSVNTTKAAAKGKEPAALPRVLMLSLENAASGTNLTQATHIILVDPICGSRSRAHAIEAQAIGRAHRLGQTQKLTVIRFLVVNTIEHETYMRNYVTKDDDLDDEEPMPETTASSASHITI